LERLRSPPSRRLDQTESSASDPLPTRIGDLAGDREGMLEGVARRVDAVLAQIDEREHRLREGSEREPLLVFDELQRLLQSLARLPIARGQHVHAAGERQRPGHLPPVLAPARALDRFVEGLERFFITGSVRKAHPAHARDRRELLVRARGLLDRLREPRLCAFSPSRLHVHEAELAMGGRGDPLRADSVRHVCGPLQCDRRLPVRTHAVHERAAESELRARTQVVVAAASRSGAGATEGVEPRIHGASGNGGFAGLELTTRRRCTE
jgi:hypothetical protein